MIQYVFKLTLFVTLLFIASFQQSSAQFPQWHNYTSNTGILDFEIDGNDIWICSMGGLVKLNKITATAVNYNGGNYGLTQNDLYRITTDTAGVLVMGGNRFFQTFDKDTTWIFTDTLTDTGNYMPIIGGAFVADKLGNVYASEGNYIIRYNNSLFDTIQLPFQGSPQIAGIAVDSSNHVWVASRYFGAAKYDGNNWLIYDTTNSILPEKFATGICVDNNNKVYVSYFVPGSQGNLFSFSNGAWSQEQSGISLLNNERVEMYVDAANSIWITSEADAVNGIIKYDGTNILAINSGLPSNGINEFQIDDQGTWFYGTDYGFYSFDGTTHRKFELSNSGLPSDIIEKVVIDEHGVKWFASYYGVTRFDGNQWETFTVANSTLSWDHISDIYADQDQGLIWVTFNPGFGNSGIAYYDGSNWNTMTPAATGGFSGGYSVTKDTNGNMWFLGSSGVAKFDYNVWTFYDAMTLSSSSSGGLVADSSGNIYVASYGAGVWQCNGTAWQLYDSTAFPNPISGSFYLFSGPNSQVYAFNGWYIYVFDGTSWTVFNPTCVVQQPNVFLPAEANTGELWLSDGEFTSMYNGVSCEEFTVSRLPDLSGSVKSVAKDLHNNYWLTYYYHGGVTVYHYDGGIDPETLYGVPTTNASGFVYIDVASNGVFDSLTDIPFANQKLLLLPDSLIRFTNALGAYNFSLESGNYIIKVIPDPTWQVTTDSIEYHVTISANDTMGFDFGLMDPNAPNELMAVEVTTGIPRCNTYFPVWINYSNQGLNTQSGLIKFSCDYQLLFNASSPAPDSIDGTNVFWNITGLTTYHQGVITLSVALDTFLIPPVNHWINTEFIKSGVTMASDTISFQGLCSLDPNDKTVSPVGTGLSHAIAPTQQLDYTIRFQNYGNDTAFYVRILDTLDAGLDFSTFRIKGSSHPCDVSLQSSGLLEVKFRNINLLWAAIDTAGSQGYFRYTIQPRSNVANNTVITNSAAIYFDFNLPVVTNQVYNTISYNITSTPPLILREEIFVYPVPVKHEIYISGISSNERWSCTIFDITGKQLQDEVECQQNQPISTRHLQSGIYFLRIESVSGKIRHVKFVIN